MAGVGNSLQISKSASVSRPSSTPFEAIIASTRRDYFHSLQVGEGEPQHEKDFQFLVAAALGVRHELPLVFTPTRDNILLRF